MRISILKNAYIDFISCPDIDMIEAVEIHPGEDNRH